LTEEQSGFDPSKLLRATRAAERIGEGAQEWFSQLQRAAEGALSAEALEEVLLEALAAIRQSLGSDAVAVLVADEQGSELVSRVSVGLNENLSPEVRIRRGAGIAGRVLATGAPLIVPDVLEVEVASPLLIESGVRSMVAVPMIASGRVIGVMHTDSTTPAHFNQADVDVLQMVADRLSSAVDRVRLFEGERAARAAAELLADRLARLQRVTAALSARLEADEVAETILSEISSEPEVISRAIWLVDDDVKRLRLVRAIGAEDLAGRFADIDLDASLPGPLCVHTGAPVYVSSVEERDRQFPDLAGLGGESTFCVLPLRGDRAVVGVLALGFAPGHVFDDDEAHFFSALADQAAPAIERARLRLVEAMWAEHLAFLADAASALGASLDESETLARVVRLMVPRVADMATVHLYDDARQLRRVALAHREPAIEAQMLSYVDDREYEARSASLAAAALRGEPMLLRDAGSTVAEQVALDREHAAMLRSLRMRSAIAVPLMARGDVLGMLSLLRVGDGAPYQDSDVALASELARRAATAIDNSRMHQRRAELARTLQASLLPPTLPAIPWLELAASYHPAGEGVEVGGDFYDIFSVGEDRWAVAIGDVCGSGPRAAAMTAQVRYTARAVARTGMRPLEVVQAVNAALVETIEEDRFCTMLYGELGPGGEGVDVELVCAGHPLPLVVRADGRVEEIQCKGQLLGVMPMVKCASVITRLEPADALVFFTDGVLEARGPDPDAPGDRTMFGSTRLREVVAAAAGQPADRVVAAVDQAVLHFASGRLADDAAVLVVRAVGNR
jgi:serine phosphatase RsbU (regulator of sigma subunit)/putative methionine-R-sulfoxide reductase with GAF domain